MRFRFANNQQELIKLFQTMVTQIPSGVSVFVIHTEQQTENFAPQLCAYLTGRATDFSLAEKYAQLHESETGIESVLSNIDLQDDDGDYTPYSIWPTPDWFNNGAGGLFASHQAEKAIADYRQKMVAEQQSLIKQKELIASLLHYKCVETLGWTKEKVEAAINKHKKEIRRIQSLERITIYPAYLSVAIFFQPAPCPPVLSALKIRAFQFSEARRRLEPHKKEIINITGFHMSSVHATKNHTQFC
jgi:hypothetical protein